MPQENSSTQTNIANDLNKPMQTKKANNCVVFKKKKENTDITKIYDTKKKLKKNNVIKHKDKHKDV
jgi:hypothetical protein